MTSNGGLPSGRETWCAVWHSASQIREAGQHRLSLRRGSRFRQSPALRPDFQLLDSDHLRVAALELLVGLERAPKARSRRAAAAASRGALLSPMDLGTRLSRFVEAAWRQAALTARAA
jgi:hypothetical protein